MSSHRPLIYRLFLNFLLLTASLLVCLIILEVSFRILEASKVIPKYGIQQQSFGYKLGKHQAQIKKSDNPNLQVENVLGEQGINQYGMRDRDYPINKHKSIIRIAAIGDSVTFGLGVPLNKTFAKRLEQQLRQTYPQQKFQVMNFGVNSYDTISEVEQIKTKVIQFDPDLILLTYILNDTMRPLAMTEMFRDKIKKKKNSSNGNSSAPFLHSFVWIAHNAKKAFNKKMSENLYKKSYEGESWQQVENAFDELSEIATNTPTMVFLFPLLMPWDDYEFEKEHAKVHKALSDRQIETIDLTPLLASYDYKKMIIRPDDNTHPNEYGHKVIADLMIEPVQKRLPIQK